LSFTNRNNCNGTMSSNLNEVQNATVGMTVGVIEVSVNKKQFRSKAAPRRLSR
jgi:hypothetical protein